MKELKIKMPIKLLMWRNWFFFTRDVPCLVRYRKCFQQMGRKGIDEEEKRKASDDDEKICCLLR